MNYLWLNMKSPYGIRLVMIRDQSPDGSAHKLIAAGGGVAKYRKELAQLGFVHEAGLKNEYWSRPLKGISNAVILNVFPLAVVESTPAEEIMPTRKEELQRYFRSVAVAQPNKLEQKDDQSKQSGNPGNAGSGLGGADASSAGKSPELGAADPRDDARTVPEDADQAGGDRGAASLPDEAAGSVGGVVPAAGVRLEEAESEPAGDEHVGAGSAQPAGEILREGDGQQRSGREPEAPGFGVDERPVNASAERAKEIVRSVASEVSADLSGWELSQAAGHWEYANLQVGDIRLRMGVSGGGVVSVDGRPHDLDNRVIDSLPQLRAVVQDRLTVPLKNYSQQFKGPDGDWFTNIASDEPFSLQFTLLELAAQYAENNGFSVEKVSARIFNSATNSVFHEVAAPEVDRQIRERDAASEPSSSAGPESVQVGMDSFGIENADETVQMYVPARPPQVPSGSRVLSSEVVVRNTKISQKDIRDFGFPPVIRAWRISAVRNSEGGLYSMVERFDFEMGRNSDQEVVVDFKEVQGHARDALDRIAPSISKLAYKAWEEAVAASTQQAEDKDDLSALEDVPVVEAGPSGLAITDSKGNIKWFGTEAKAEAFLDKNGLKGTHQVVISGRSRFEIHPLPSPAEHVITHDPLPLEEVQTADAGPSIDPSASSLFAIINTGFWESAGGTYTRGKEYPVTVNFRGISRDFAVRRDSSGGPFKLRTLLTTDRGLEIATYQIDQGSNLVEKGRRNLWALTQGAEEAEEFKALFERKVDAGGAQPARLTTVDLQEFAIAEIEAFLDERGLTGRERQVIAEVESGNEAVMERLLKLGIEQADTKSFAEALEHVDFGAIRERLIGTREIPTYAEELGLATKEVAAAPAVPVQSDNSADTAAAADAPVDLDKRRLVESGEVVEMGAHEWDAWVNDGMPSNISAMPHLDRNGTLVVGFETVEPLLTYERSKWLPSKWEDEVRALFDEGDYQVAFDLYQRNPNAEEGETLEAFISKMHSSAGGVQATLNLKTSQRSYLSRSGLNSTLISRIAYEGVGGDSPDVRRWAESREEELEGHMVRAGWSKGFRSFMFDGIRIKYAGGQGGWDYSVIDEKSGSVLDTIRDEFDRDADDFASHLIAEATAPRVSSASPHVDDEADDSADVSVDRIWRGLKMADLWSSHVSLASSSVWNDRQAMETLARAESKGLDDLPGTARQALLAFFGWGGNAAQLRVDNTRVSQNSNGVQIADKLGITAGDFNKKLLANRLESYYTPAQLIKPMWEALERLGVSYSSKVMDAGCGAAYFFVGAPEGYQQHARFVGIECDDIALRAARVNAPDAVFINQRFEQAVLDKSFDAVVGNVPFGETKVADRRYPGLSHIHDYFIVKSLDHLADGGCMAVITSSGTMDKVDDSIRQQMMQRANLVAAYRLPNKAFEGTGADVATDILILQKRPAGTVPDSDFTATGTISVKGLEKTHEFTVNQYFIDNPTNVLGPWAIGSSAYGPKLKVGFEHNTPIARALLSISAELSARVSLLPEGIRNRTDWKAAGAAFKLSQMHQAAEEDVNAIILSSYAGFVGDYTVVDGELIEIIDIIDQFDDDGVRTGQRYLAGPLVVSKPGHVALLHAYIPLRDAARALMRSQLSGDDEELRAAQSSADALYKEFVSKFGPVNLAKNQRVFADDAGAAEVLALEVWDDEKDELVKVADAFTARVIRSAEPVEINTPVDAFYVSLDQKGKVDFEYMASISGLSDETLRTDLLGNQVFVDPLTGEYVAAFQYLSGNVVKKLADAREASLTSERWLRNVEALEGVQPAPIPFADITIKLGTNWIPADDICQFAASLFSVGRLGVGDFNVSYHAGANMWTVDVSDAFKRNHSANRTALWGTPSLAFEGLLERLLNNTRPTHTKKLDTGAIVVDDEATMASRAKQEEINDAFHRWVASDEERAEKYAKLYNECTNVFVLPKVDGSRLTFPGLSPSWSPRFHQSGFVSLTMMGFNAMAAHPVGAGKTWEMVASAIKLKQLGMLNKPMIAVPNHMLGQITREAKQMYPGARILMITKDDLKGASRKRFLAITRNNDWDLVVLTHSMLNGISPPLETTLAEYDREIDVIELKIAEADNRRVERRLQAKLKTVESKRAEVVATFEDQSMRDGVLTLDQLGVDGIYVDEMHLYKNLDLNSGIQVLGVTTDGSSRAFNLWGLSQYLRELHGKSFGVFGFTGTSIANSMCEAYVHNKILRPDLLEELGITHFDEWANRFGTVVTGLEALPEGGGFRVNERFSKFVNAPEMLKLFRSFADVRTKEELNLPTPKVETKLVVVEQTEWQKAHMGHLAIRAMAVRNSKGEGRVDPREDNMLAISTAGRKASLDMRLIESDLPDDSSLKLEAVAANMIHEYHLTADVKGTQLGFMDLGTPGAHKEFSTYVQLKKILVQNGLPEKDIAFIHDAKTPSQKEALFAKVRSGEVRIVLGSTEKMGVGTNVQERMCALHNIDCPWRPADIEQRLGRLARQGNLYFKDVREYRYTTKDSFDLFMWETNKRKAQFINQALSDPDSAGREITEEMDLGFAEVMALTTGNPKIREKVELDDQVAKMERKYRSWLGDICNRRSHARGCERVIEDATYRLSIERQAQDALPKSPYKVVEVRGAIKGLQDGSTTWLYATQAGQAILAKLPFVEANMMRNNERTGVLNVFLGDLEIRAQRLGNETLLVGVVDGEVLPQNQVTISKSDQSMGRKIRDWYGSDERVRELQGKLEQAKRQLAVLGDVSFSTDWPQQAELDDLKSRQREVDAWFASQEVIDSPTEDPFMEMLATYRISKRQEPDVLERYEPQAAVPEDVSDLFGFQDVGGNDIQSNAQSAVSQRLG